MFNKILTLFFLLILSFVSNAGSLTEKSKSMINNEIQGLSVSDTKQFITSESNFKSEQLEKIALSSEDGKKGNEIVERSMGCSTGCSTGCSSGCSSGCSYGCSYGCSTGCR